MSTIMTFSSAHLPPLTFPFFIMRRPVLDGSRHLAAHALVFRHAGADAPDGAAILADVARHGFERLAGGASVYLPVDGAALSGALPEDLPRERVVLSLDKAIRATPELLECMQGLARRGFVFAADAATDLEQMKLLLPLVRIVRIDIVGRGPERLRNLCRLLKAHHKKLLAESVGTIAQFEQCAAAGFDYFEGGFVTAPQGGDGGAPAPSRQAVAGLIALIEADADDAAIEHGIKSDVALGLRLLRLAADMPAAGARRLESLRQAQMMVGRDRLLRWLQAMLREDAGSSPGRLLPLLMLAARRARLLELAAYKLVPGNRGVADTAFMVGIMSLMDVAFHVPLQELLSQIPVPDEVRAALLDRGGRFGRLLALAEQTEAGERDCRQLEQTIRDLRLTHDDLFVLQLAAFEWSDQAARG